MSSSEISESPLIQTFPDRNIIKEFCNTKLNDNGKFSNPADNKNCMCDNQFYELTIETEAIKFYVFKESITEIKNQSEQRNNKETINFFRNKINFDASK